MKSFNLQIAIPIMYVAAAVIVASSLFYSNYLANQLEAKERQTIEWKAGAIKVYTAEPDTGQQSPFEIAAQDYVGEISLADIEVPWILTDENLSYISSINIGIPDTLAYADQIELAKPFIRRLRAAREPLRVDVGGGYVNYVLYGESNLLKQLRWFPIAQLIVAAAFIGFVLLAFAIAKRNEQNKVWVGLAKETAHQLGTPVSSLMAWIELLKINLEERPDDQQYVIEMEQDVKRLEDITERFSKIGSEPELVEISVRDVLDRSAKYLKKRMTRKGNITLEVDNQLPPNSHMHINPQLINWVIENLLKNALDAIQDKKGSIKLQATEQPNAYIIDVIDSGKGMPKSNFKKVFQPGFTTKKRGWGLGLSLSKRIIENYHKGKIFVKTSEQGKGTTFRIILPKQN